MALEDCKCCRESSSLLSEKLEGIKCISDNNDFKILCLNRTALVSVNDDTKINLKI